MEIDELIRTECRAYDDGHRHALRDALRDLAAQATRQAQRSGETATRKHAHPGDAGLHAADCRFADRLTEMVRSRS